MSPARARTRTALSEVEHTTHEVTATPTIELITARNLIRYICSITSSSLCHRYYRDEVKGPNM